MPVSINKISDTKLEIVGTLDGREIITLDGDGAKWVVGMSRSLSGDALAASAQLAVYNEAFDKMNELRAQAD